MSFFIDTVSLYSQSPQIDKFDLIVIQEYKRCRIIRQEQDDFKFINKQHQLIIQQYKKEQKKIKENLNRYVKDLLFNESCIISKKKDLLIDSFYEVINDDDKISDLKFMTDNIFLTSQHIKINFSFIERCKLIQKHLYYTMHIKTTNDIEECIICKELIKKIFLKKCI